MSEELGPGGRVAATASAPLTPAQAPRPVLYVHYGDDWIRGSERCLLDLLRHVDRGQYRPYLWCNSEELAGAARELEVPVHVDRFPLLFNWVPPRFDVMGYARLVQRGLTMVREHGIQLVHSNSGAPCQWMLPVSRTARVPLVAHLHAIYESRERHIYGLHNVDTLVGVSPSALEGFKADAVAARKLRVIYNGIDPDRLERGDADDIRRALSAAPGPVVAVVASLIERKAVDVAMRAFARAATAHPGARLLIMGDGPLRGQLEALAHSLGIAHATHFTGECNSVGPALRDCADILLSASRLEALPLSLLEGWWYRLPVIATNVEGHRDIVQDGVNGLLVPADDEVGLAHAIERLASNPTLRARLGSAGREFVSERFLMHHNARAFECLYEELLGQAKSSWVRPWHSPKSTLRWLTGVVAGRVRRGVGA